jgi:hypothetical protein
VDGRWGIAVTYLGPAILLEHWYGCARHAADVVPALGTHHPAHARLLLWKNGVELSVATFVPYRGRRRLAQLKEVWRFEACGDSRYDGGHARGRCKAGWCLQTVSWGGFRSFFFLFLLFLVRFLFFLI